MENIMNRFLKVVGIIALIIVLVVGTVIGYLTVDEYKPQDVEAIAIEGNAQKSAALDSTIRVMSWNVGYGALGDNADFFMDGGRMVKSATKERVYSNLTGIMKEVETVDPDILFTQEMDRNSTRSYFIDESEYLKTNSPAGVFDGQSAFAYNFKVAFVPLPVPPIGKVEAGLGLFSKYRLDSAVRLKLPCPFTWPLRTMNLKRCLEVARVPISDSDKELVLVNLHLEAYDDGEGKIAQTNMLRDILTTEYEKGNFVVAGGDFNQIFSGVDSGKYPPVGSAAWQPAVIDENIFGDGFNFYMDEDVPSCRSLDRPLDTAQSKDPADFQYYIIDGFIVSKNIDVENVYIEDLGFVSADHNPLIMDIRLK